MSSRSSTWCGRCATPRRPAATRGGRPGWSGIRSRRRYRKTSSGRRSSRWSRTAIRERRPTLSLDTHATGPLAHHFENLEQQREANTLGMWLFLASEILFFGGLFTAYTMMRRMHPEMFALASYKLNAVLGGFNTAILLTSSFTMAMAVWSAQTKNQKLLRLFLGLTLLFGTAFLVVKGYEWSEEYRHHLVPGPTFGLDHDGHVHVEGRDGQLLDTQQLKGL